MKDTDIVQAYGYPYRPGDIASALVEPYDNEPRQNPERMRLVRYDSGWSRLEDTDRFWADHDEARRGYLSEFLPLLVVDPHDVKQMDEIAERVRGVDRIRGSAMTQVFEQCMDRSAGEDPNDMAARYADRHGLMWALNKPGESGGLYFMLDASTTACDWRKMHEQHGPITRLG